MFRRDVYTRYVKRTYVFTHTYCFVAFVSHACDGLENESIPLLYLSHVHHAVDEQCDVTLEFEMRREEEEQMEVGKRTRQVAVTELDEDALEVFSRPKNQTICWRKR